MKQPESEVFADATNAAGALLKCQCFGGAISAFYEKNAIFSAWLMRRIGASGSDVAAAGRFRIPRAISEEPSEGSSEA